MIPFTLLATFLLSGALAAATLWSPGGTLDRGSAAADDPMAIDWTRVRIQDLPARTLEGKQFPMVETAGKVLLIVNVASRCGYTRQYTDLQALHERFAERGLVVIGVPSNDFGNQEPGSAEEIREFCTTRFSVTFPMLEKVSVRPGDEQSPIFRALAARTGEAPKWNFTKYLVARDGVRASVHGSRVNPRDEAFVELIERLLTEPAPGAETDVPTP